MLKALSDRTMVTPIAFLSSFYRCWQRSFLFTRAGSLTFSGILAMVPLMVIAIALLSVLPFAHLLQSSIQDCCWLILWVGAVVAYLRDNVT